MFPEENLVYPNYANSLVNLPSSLLRHFGITPQRSPLKSALFKQIEGCSKIVLFVIDGFGYTLWEKEAEKNTFFRKIKEKRLVEKITTVFPSATATGLTSLNSGVTPREHGLLEWNLYFRELDVHMETLPYKMIPTSFHPLQTIPENPSLLLNGTTLSERLAQNSIPTCYFLPKEFQHTVYTRAITKGATIIPFLTIADLMIALCHQLETTKGKAFYYVYWRSIDMMEHEYGPYADEVSSEVALLSSALDNLFLARQSDAALKETAMILTADHGQLPVFPEHTIYLNHYPQVTKHFKKSRSGKPILPTGSPRDVFLSIADDKVDEVVHFLHQALKESAYVLTMNDATIPALFGEGIQHREFLSRLGNVLILPRGTNTVWYEYLSSGKQFTHKGHHGGLTPEEMCIPLVVAKLSQLR